MPFDLIIRLIIVIIVAIAILGVVRAILATPDFQKLGPYAGVIYALIVLLLVLACVQMFYGGGWVFARPTR